MHAKRRPFAGRLAFFATLAVSLLLALGTAGAAFGDGGKEAKTQDHKVTLCHAAGLAGTTHYVTITIARQAAEHHLDPETGTPRAGHGQASLAACTPPPPPPPPPPPGDNKGFLEICKQADGSGVTGSFEFAIAGRPETVSVPVGACSFPIQLPAGTA